ncbi:hypothetical protein N7G274_001722 [Stereocaulon virgatum]|uniref:Uncharacterized protein n=1 Tax=Stereocaulon virgatum TaxID=373712 RepID=A0ABR4AM34_9LECA
MTSQEAFLSGESTLFVLREEEDPPESVAGETKTHNVPKNEQQRGVVTFRDSEPGLTVSVEMVLCVHGWENPDKQQAVSLMVFDYKLHYTKGDYYIRSVETEFVFDEMTVSTALGGERANPEVLAYAPFEKELRWNETTADVKNERHGDAKVGGNYIATAEVSAGGAKEISHQQKYFDRGVASRKYNNKSRRWDRVSWFLQQNGIQGHGVPSTFSVAILLRRASDPMYTGTFDLRVEAGLWENLKSGIRRFFRKTEDDPVIFNPKRRPEGSRLMKVQKDIDEEKLGALAKDDELIKLVKVWGLDLESFGPLQPS